MDKKPLIGVSIIAVVLLVLGSLSNVVGYQSVKSTAVNDSPLFRTRTLRATNQQQNILTSQYLGKGTDSFFQFPIKNNRTESLKNFFESMKKMDDATFQRFLAQVKQRLTETTSLNKVQLNEINQELINIKNQVNLPVLSLSQEPPSTFPSNCISVGSPLPNLCVLLAIIYLLIILLLMGG
jgi:hypothetical protein